ncbi:MAG: hypothetical protein L3J33_05010 [Rhodobacteraceae bacterium]|nr:hypothetical protein [Paracoccaceae bacterium]
MSKLDDLIVEALSELEKEVLEGTEEQGWFSLSTNLFRGKLGWVSWVIMAVQSTMFIAGAYTSWKFFQAAETISALQWGLVSTVLLLGALMLKLSMMPQIQANRILRELKRVELLILHTKS